MNLERIGPPCFVLLAGLVAAGAARSEDFALDPVHTRIAFQVSHAGFSSPIGTFSGVEGRLSFDPEDWSTARIEATVPIASLNLGDEDWQRRILDRTFFDAGRFPVARFVSTRVQKTGERSGTVEGMLSLHGVTRPVTLTITFNQLKRHPLPPFRRTAGFSATAVLHRSDFGMDHWKNLVGDEVRLIIEAEAVRDKSGPSGENDHADPQ